jgi:hypothetical protein
MCDTGRQEDHDTKTKTRRSRREHVDVTRGTGMETLTTPQRLASDSWPVRWRPVAYWLATVAVAAELGVGGCWDIARLHSVETLVTHLGYPSYFLVLLGTWKVLAAAAILVPRFALLKEWAYAGAFFIYSGAIVSHLTRGYEVAELRLLIPLTVLTVLSWALRPASRRTAACTHAP